MGRDIRIIESKVLGAMLILADDNMELEASNKKIAEIMGYKTSGGAITFAIDALEIKNYISRLGKWRYKVLL